MLDALAARQALAAGKAAIDYGLHMTIGPSDCRQARPGGRSRAPPGAAFQTVLWPMGLRLTDGELLRTAQTIRDVGRCLSSTPKIETLSPRSSTAIWPAGRTTPTGTRATRPLSQEPQPRHRHRRLGERRSTFPRPVPPPSGASAAAKAQGCPSPARRARSISISTQDVYDRPGVGSALPVCTARCATQPTATLHGERAVAASARPCLHRPLPFTRAEGCRAGRLQPNPRWGALH